MNALHAVFGYTNIRNCEVSRMNTEYIDINDIAVSGTPRERINKRPIWQIVGRGVVGIGMMLFRTKATLISGGFFLALAVMSFFVISDTPVLDLYDDCMVVYHPLDAGKAFLIKYDWLNTWSVDGANNRTVFTLRDGEGFAVNTARYNKTYNALKKIIPDKMEKTIVEKVQTRREKGKQGKLS